MIRELKKVNKKKKHCKVEEIEVKRKRRRTGGNSEKKETRMKERNKKRKLEQ